MGSNILMTASNTAEETGVLLIDCDATPKGRRDRIRESMANASPLAIWSYSGGNDVSQEEWERTSAVVGHLSDVKGSIPSHFTGRVICYSGANLSEDDIRGVAGDCYRFDRSIDRGSESPIPPQEWFHEFCRWINKDGEMPGTWIAGPGQDSDVAPLVALEILCIGYLKALEADGSANPIDVSGWFKPVISHIDSSFDWDSLSKKSNVAAEQEALQRIRDFCIELQNIDAKHNEVVSTPWRQRIEEYRVDFQALWARGFL